MASCVSGAHHVIQTLKIMASVGYLAVGYLAHGLAASPKVFTVCSPKFVDQSCHQVTIFQHHIQQLMQFLAFPTDLHILGIADGTSLGSPVLLETGRMVTDLPHGVQQTQRREVAAAAAM